MRRLDEARVLDLHRVVVLHLNPQDTVGNTQRRVFPWKHARFCGTTRVSVRVFPTRVSVRVFPCWKHAYFRARVSVFSMVFRDRVTRVSVFSIVFRGCVRRLDEARVLDLHRVVVLHLHPRNTIERGQLGFRTV